MSSETVRAARAAGGPVLEGSCALALVVLAVGAGYLTRGEEFGNFEFWQTHVVGRIIVFAFSAIILAQILHARRGGPMFIRRIPGLTAVDQTVGRATEMGRPITFSLGLGGLDIITLQSLAIALHVIRMAIRFGTRVIVTLADPTIYAVADEAVRDAYATAGRPESYNLDDVRFLSDRQFAYASSAMGLILREKVASNYMFGRFFAESLILAEAGNQVGAIQVAGTPIITQIPFFIAACDYTIIGDEYYAATAYLTREPVLSGSLVGQDRAKMLIMTIVVLGLLLATFVAITHIGADPKAEPDAFQWLLKTAVSVFKDLK
jgi:hypothetical protein